MLTCVTGLPGAGKTLYLLSRVIKEYRGRQIYTFAIPGIDHEKLGTQPLDDPEKWYELPEGSVIVIDESQKVFPKRKQGAPVPPKVEHFQTHRHKGFDIILLTQDGMLLDPDVRRFIGKHIHVHRLFGAQAATIYQYPTFESNPTAKTTQKAALSVSTYKYDKATYQVYKSADLHTVKRNIPVKLIVVSVLMAAAIIYIGWAIYYLTGDFMNPDPEPEAVAQAQGGEVVPRSPPRKPLEQEKGSVIEDPAEYARMMTPLIEGLPHSAPFYQSQYKAADYPRPQCIIVHAEGGDQCSCYTQQATVYDTTEELCRYYVQNGFFDPARPAPRDAAGSEARAPAASSRGPDDPSYSSRTRNRPTSYRAQPVAALPAANKVVPRARPLYQQQPYSGYPETNKNG